VSSLRSWFDKTEGLTGCHLGPSIVEDPPGIRTPVATEPLRFPFDVQHSILSEVQRLLEESCFRFMELWLPSVLKKHGWNCAAAIELTKSLSLVKSCMKDLPDNCVSTAEKASFQQIAPVLAQLRHAAVHRRQLGSDELLHYIWSALKLVEIVRHKENMAVLQRLSTQIEIHAKNMDHHAEAMKQHANCTLSQIQKEKETLAQKERNLQEFILQQQIDIPAAAGKALFDSVNAFLPTRKPNEAIGGEREITYSEPFESTSYDIVVDENDIESDEDQLRVELE
jgi:hypothetical protein